MPRKKNLTVISQREQIIYGFIGDYRKHNGYSPSMREIGEFIGIGSTSLISYYLDRLEMLGKITRNPKIPRSIVPTGQSA